MEMNKVTKQQLIISVIFNGSNTLLFIYYILQTIKRPFLLVYITIWSYYLNSINIFLNLLCDIFLFLSNPPSQTSLISIEENLDYNLVTDINSIQNKTKSIWEKINEWNRNDFSIISNPFSYFVSICFWFLFFMGENFMKVSTSPDEFFGTIYQHLLITIFVIIDIFNSKRKKTVVNGKDFGIITLVFIGYFIEAYIAKYFYGINIYAFMRGANFAFLVLFAIFSYMFIFFCYLFQVWIVNFCNERKIGNEKKGSEIKKNN